MPAVPSEQRDLAPRFRRHPWDRRFYVAFAVAACALVFFGFGPTYYYRLLDPATAIASIVHLHAVVFSAWMVLFLVQTLLVERGRTGLHVRLGWVGALLAIAIVVVGYLTLIEGARTGYLGPGVERNTELSPMFMIVPMRDLVWFIVSVALAIHYRGRPETHKRLMILVFVGGLMPVVLARVPNPLGMIIGLLFLIVPPIFDLVSRRRIHRVYLIGVPLFVVPSVALQPLAATPAWRRFAEWLLG